MAVQQRGRAADGEGGNGGAGMLMLGDVFFHQYILIIKNNIEKIEFT